MWIRSQVRSKISSRRLHESLRQHPEDLDEYLNDSYSIGFRLAHPSTTPFLILKLKGFGVSPIDKNSKKVSFCKFGCHFGLVLSKYVGFYKQKSLAFYKNVILV